MLTAPAPVKDVDRSLEHRIIEQLGNRVQNLRVEVAGARVTVLGSAPCYFDKQFASQAILALVDSLPEFHLRLLIDVARTGPRPGRTTPRGFLTRG